MATSIQNKRYWNEEYQWDRKGEEWSGTWGDSALQWTASILPRIRAFLPAETILEIGPGFGRWTTFLKDYCDRLFLVDIADKCVAACRERFQRDAHISYSVTDGDSLAMIPDASVDFAFSFDSLVHVEAQTIDCYLKDLAKKLTTDGVAFVHHSNIGEYAGHFARLDQLGWARKPLAAVGMVEQTGHGRARSMTAERFRQSATDAGLACVGQELVNWNTKPSHLIDCFSIVTREGSKFHRPHALTINGDFMREARKVRALRGTYQNITRTYDRFNAGP